MDKQYISAEVEQTDKGMVAVASTSSQDRQGDVVHGEGWELKSFKKNPVLLWGHDHAELPIGTAKRIWVEGTGKKAKLMFEPLFHEVTDKAKAIKRLFQEGILKAFSVGFRPIDSEGNNYTKQELLEISAVNVPANAEAMMLAYKSLREEFSEDVMQDIGIPAGLIEKIGSLEEKYKLMEGKLDSAVKGLEHLASPTGRDSQLVTSRLAVVKSIAKASDKMLAKKAMSRRKRERLVKAVKQKAEQLIVAHKEELNGKNKRTQGKANQR